MIKNYFFLIILVFLAQCGYKPIYSQNNQNFEIKNIELNRNKNNKILETRLSNYKIKNEPIYFYDLKIETSENKSILSKNTQGEAVLLRIKISLKLEVFEKEKLMIEKKYFEQFDYKSISRKFELTNYENEIRVEMYNELIAKILMDLTNLK
tara:strand:- start:321 stop:776 length:456 start_codon:yes stop_codon:yes gene_type:complete